MKALIIAALILAPMAALAADDGVPPTSLTSASSGNVAAATATATLTATPGYLALICGFAITSTGSTNPAAVSATVTGLKGGTLTYAYTTVAGVTLPNAPLNMRFQPCIPASAPNVAIVVSLPSLGTGNTNAAVTAGGYTRPWP